MNLEMLHRRRLVAQDLSMYEPETIKYMNEIHVRHSETETHYAGTPQEKTGKQLWDIMDTYVKGLKGASLWNKIKVDYPMVGGTATRHAINIIDPDQYIVSWYGGWVHNEFGAKPNGFNCYGYTGFIPLGILDVNSNGLTIATGTNEIPLYEDSMMFGSMFESVKNSFDGICISASLDGTYFGRMNLRNARYINTDIPGVYTGTRTNTVGRHFKNKTFKMQIVANGQMSPHQFVLGCGGSADGGPDTRNGWDIQRIQAAMGHEGLTDAEIITLHDIIDTRESALNRKTW